jgi:hypothetical protein
MIRRRPLVALAAITVLALSACSQNDAKESDVVDAMRDAGLNQQQAECVGQGFQEEFGDDQDQFNKVAAAAKTEDFPEGTEEPIRQILDRCVNGDGSSDSSDTTDTSDTTSADETTTTTAG